MEIKVRYHADIYPLEQTEKGDWIDLRSAETVELKAGELLFLNQLSMC